MAIVVCAVYAAVMAEGSLMRFHSGAKTESVKISDIDTIRFSGGKINLKGNAPKVFDISSVDSVTFATEPASGDTVFVTFNGSSAEVVNPYPNIAAKTSGANVSIASSAGIKGIVYYLSGSADGAVFSFTPDCGYTLVLDNLTLANSTFMLNQAADGSSYAATVNLIGKSSISDAAGSSVKGALYSKSKLKIYDEASGELSVMGNTKHGISSSKRIEIYGGSVSVASSSGDCINADGVEMYGGKLSVAATAGDGLDCSELVRVADGEITLSVIAEDVKGIKCDSVVEILGGKISAEVSGAGSKGIKSVMGTTVSGGEVSVVLSADTPFAGEDNDYGYNAALLSDADIVIEKDAAVRVTGSGVAARGLKADGNISILGGSFKAELYGPCYDETINADTVSVMAVKAQGMVTISGGSIDIYIAEESKVSKGIRAGSVEISGGNVSIENKGGYFYTVSQTSSGGNSGPGGRGGQPWGSTSSIEVSASESKAVKADENVSLTGGNITLKVPSGKGISSDKSVVIGTEDGSDAGLTLTIEAGSEDELTYTKSGENSRTKYNCSPKGINTDGNVMIHSGTVNIKSYDSAIKGSSVTVSGGKIDLWAAYDQGIHGIQELTISGGDIYISASYEALEGVVMKFTGGVTTCVASDDVWNASVSSSGSGTPSLTVSGGYHYLHIDKSGDTDVIDSNGSISFAGGVTVIESSGNSIDADGSTSYSGGVVMAFASKAESCPTAGNPISVSTISSGTRYSVGSGSNVLSTFVTSQSATKLIYINSENTGKSVITGGTYTPGTEVSFRNLGKYGFGGSISGGTSSTTSSYSAEGMGGGGGGFRP